MAEGDDRGDVKRALSGHRPDRTARYRRQGLSTKSKAWLCRCGASTKKPFCDGTHSKIGFQAAARPCRDRRKGADQHAL